MSGDVLLNLRVFDNTKSTGRPQKQWNDNHRITKQNNKKKRQKGKMLTIQKKNKKNCFIGRNIYDGCHVEHYCCTVSEEPP